MNSTARLCLVLSALASLFLFTSCESLKKLLDKKDDDLKKVSISFHAMASENDMKKTMFPVEIGGKQVLFKLVPEFTQENITAFHSFNSEDGKSNGVTLKLDFRGAANLEIVTRTPPGEYLMAMVNGQPVDFLALDTVISDGMVTIWQGVPDSVVKKMDKKYPRLQGGAAPSMSPEMDMGAISKSEKKEAYNASKAAERKAKLDEKTGKKEHGLKMPELPQSAPSPKIPVEGGAAPGVPLGDLPLPRP